MSRSTYYIALVISMFLFKDVSAQDNINELNKKRIATLKESMSNLYDAYNNSDSLIVSLIQLVRQQRDSLKLLSQMVDEYKNQPSHHAYAGMCNCSRIYYDIGKHKANYSAYAELDSIASLLKINDALRLSLVGHADRSGSATLNHSLALKRAEDLKQFLIDQYGIEANRITTEGRGSDEHIKEITDPYLFHLDRRVEIFLVKP